MISRADSNSNKITKSNNNPNENFLSILGPVECGKTVIISLLDEVIHRYFQDHEKYIFTIEDGVEYLKKISNRMYTGLFPERNQELFDERVVLRISNKDPLVKGNLDITIRDISGEAVTKLCSTGDMNEEQRKNIITKFGKPKTSTGHSPFNFIIHAKMYLIIIDCADFENWSKLDWDYAQLLQTLSRITGQDDEYIDVPLAIILSKSDLIPNNDKTGDIDYTMKILQEKMFRFTSMLKNKHRGHREYFQLYVKPGSKPGELKIPLSYNVEEYKKLFNMIIKNIK